MTLTQSFHRLDHVETADSTSQYIELSGLSTNYAQLYFTFTGYLNWSGTNYGAGQRTWNGPTLQFQGAWPGGANASAASYRCFGTVGKDSSNSTYSYLGDMINSSSYTVSPNWANMGNLYYPSGTFYADRNRFTIEMWVLQPRDNQVKTVMWYGGQGPPDTGSYNGTPLLQGAAHLCGQTSTSAPTAMGPFDSIRIGAGCDTAGGAQTFGTLSSFTAYGMGNSSTVNTGNAG